MQYTYHPLIDDDFESFEEKFIRSNKLKYVNGGAFANVWETSKRSKFVYKIGHLSICDHDGYMCFLRHVVSRSKGNKHLPQIEAFNLYSYEGQDGETYYFYIVKMERLVSWWDLSPRQRVSAAKEFRNSDHWTDREINFQLGDMLWDIRYYLRRSVRDENYLIEDHHDFSRSLFAVLKQIKRTIKNVRGLYGDFHDENFMFRKVGRNYELVITDPLS